MMTDPNRILTSDTARWHPPSKLSWFGLAFGLLTAAAATVAFIIVESGRARS